MKREDVINSIVKSVSSLKKSDAGKIYNAIIQHMFDALKAGDTVRLSGIGALSVTVRKETTYRNPQTKQLIQKPAHKRVKFSMSKSIKEEINS